MRAKRRSPVFAMLIGLLIALSVPTEAFACWICKKSPNYWGFCRSGYSRGHGDCTEYVADPWTGRTDCQISEWGTCGPLLGDGTCDPDEEGCEIQPEHRAANRPCSWTDLSATALV